jgi:hypothetical protein
MSHNESEQGNKWTVVSFENKGASRTATTQTPVRTRPLSGVVSDTVQVTAVGNKGGFMTSWKVTSKRQSGGMYHESPKEQDTGTSIHHETSSSMALFAVEQFRIALDLSRNPTPWIYERPSRMSISIRDLLVSD